MRIDRMMSIILILLNQERVTAKELSEKFEVSIRTIYRDIEAIDLAGIPIISYPGNTGGFSIMDNYKLNNQLLTLNNLCSLITTLKGINYSLEDNEIDSSIEKLRNLVPQDKVNHLELQMDQIIVNMPSWANTTRERSLIKDIRKSIEQSYLITIEYRNRSNEITLREIEPISIVFKGFTWHLFAYCHLKKDYRVFRISRIINIKKEDEIFHRRGVTYLEYEELARKKDEYVPITLKFDSHVRALVEDIFVSDNIVTLSTGEMIVTAHFPDQDWFMSLIMSFGHQVEVLEPKSIRDIISKNVKLMYDKYYS